MNTHTPIPLNQSAVPTRSQQFARALFARLQWHCERKGPEDFLREIDSGAKAFLARTAAAPGSTATAGWAAELARTVWGDYLGSLAPYSGAARLIAQALGGAVSGENMVQYPVRVGGPNVPPWVPESGPIPVRALSFTSVTLGPPKKMGHMVVWSRELNKRCDARDILLTMLREDVAAGLDSAFFSTDAGSDAAQAGLLYGVTALAGYAGSDDVAMKTDLTALAAAVATGGSGKVTFIMAPERAAKLAILDPELAANIDVAPSAAVPANRIVAADPLGLIVSVDEEPEIDISNDALIAMNDTALEIVSAVPVVANPVRSTFQTATLAVRVLHFLCFAKRRSTAVAYIDGVTW